MTRWLMPLVLGALVGLTAVVAIVASTAARAGGRAEVPLPPASSAADMERLMNNPNLDRALSPTGHSAPAAGAALEHATFGAGCFWGVEEFFRRTPGVVATAVGFAGGTTDKPSYKQVCYEDTGHAEVVQLQFDPSKVSYEALLDIFWNNHNPTTLNRQGPDFGSQYRSVIFYHGDAQRQAAETSKARQQAEGKWASRSIVTFIEPAPLFYKAEDYHQRYLEKQGLSSCHAP